MEYDDLLLTEAKRKVKAGFGGRSSTVTASSEEVPHSEPEVVQEPVLKKRREGLVQVNIISVSTSFFFYVCSKVCSMVWFSA